jgi:SAM-dependent methyltransferase
LDKVTLGAGEEMPYDDGTFDLVTAFDVVEHMDDDLAGLKEMRRVLRPGGRVRCCLSNVHFLWGLQDEVSITGAVSLPNSSRARAGGFEIERTLREHHFLPAICWSKTMRLTGIKTTPRTHQRPALNGVWARYSALRARPALHQPAVWRLGLCVARAKEYSAPRNAAQSLDNLLWAVRTGGITTRTRRRT